MGLEVEHHKHFSRFELDYISCYYPLDHFTSKMNNGNYCFFVKEMDYYIDLTNM